METKIYMFSAKHKQYAFMHFETEPLQENYLSIYDFNPYNLGNESSFKNAGGPANFKTVLWPWGYYSQIIDRFLLFLTFLFVGHQ